MKRLIPVLGLVLFLVSPLYGEPPVVHTASGLVRLPGNVPPALSRATRVSGTLAGDTPVTLTIVLNRTDQSGFDAFLRAVQDPSVPNFRHYLSQRELADRFGPTTQAYGAVLEWLQQQGFTLVEGSANQLTIIVRGTRAQTEQAFGVRLNDYRLGNRTFYSNDRGPALPAAIASHVQAVVGLSNLARPVRAHSTYAATQIAQQLRNSRVDDLAFTCWLAWKLTTEWKEAVKEVSQEREFAENLKLIAQSAGLTLLRYACIADELNMLNLLANKLPLPINLPLGSPFSDEDPPAPGTGQTVGLLEFDNFHPLDVQDFLNLIGQGSQFAQLPQIHVAGGAEAPGADESEVLLDIDAVMSLAPGAQVIVFDGPFSGRGSFQAMFNAMINDGRVTIISNSWAYCEDQTTLADVQSLDNVLANAAAAGITVLTGAGDQGSTCLDGSPNTVHVPASSPHITAVGGTSVTHNVGGTYGSEHWWDSSAELVPGGQGGFGLSRFFPRPSYQDGLSTAPMRSVPDVTMAADPATAGYFICQADAGGCPSGLLYGGTSVATPLWAAIVAVLNQQENRQLGFLNPLLYPLAHTTAFHSAAELGSDVVHVGLGTPNVGQLHLALTGGTAGPVDLATSYVSAFPALVVADGTSPAGVAVLLSDTAGNAVSGQSV